MSEQMVSILRLLLLLKEDYRCRKEQSCLGKRPGKCGTQGNLASPTRLSLQALMQEAKIITGGAQIVMS